MMPGLDLPAQVICVREGSTIILLFVMALVLFMFACMLWVKGRRLRRIAASRGKPRQISTLSNEQEDSGP